MPLQARRQRTSSSLACVLSGALLVIACDFEGSDTASPSARSDRDRPITFAEAVATARARVPEGTPVEVEIEHLDGRELIEVEMLVGKGIREVYIDPDPSEVVAVQDEEDSEPAQHGLFADATALEGAKVSLADAAERAAAHAGGEVREVEYIVVDGALVLVVEVRADGGTNSVRLDPADGRVLSTSGGGASEYDEHDEHDEHDDEDDHDDG